jgi:hypothetical protein
MNCKSSLLFLSRILTLTLIPVTCLQANEFQGGSASPPSTLAMPRRDWNSSGV